MGSSTPSSVFPCIEQQLWGGREDRSYSLSDAVWQPTGTAARTFIAGRHHSSATSRYGEHCLQQLCCPHAYFRNTGLAVTQLLMAPNAVISANAVISSNGCTVEQL